jgi:membrane-bound inhibitor of C-type lysozyme
MTGRGRGQSAGGIHADYWLGDCLRWTGFTRPQAAPGVNMKGCRSIIFGAALGIAAAAAGSLPASAQTFQNYRCADGTRFVAGFYQYGTRAFVQVDGGSVILARRFFSLSGSRYSGGGVTLNITRSGARLKHAAGSATTCELG